MDSNTADRGMDELRSRIAADPEAGIMRPWLRATIVEGVHGAAEFEQYGRVHRFESDEAVDRGGSGAAPSPLRYLLAALAFCTQGWMAKEFAQRALAARTENVDVRTVLDMAGELGMGASAPHPPWFVLDIAVFSDKAEDDAVVEAVRAGVARCPVASLIAAAVPLRLLVRRDDRVLIDERDDVMRRDDERELSR